MESCVLIPVLSSCCDYLGTGERIGEATCPLGKAVRALLGLVALPALLWEEQGLGG